jgi:hypothetical protein
MLDLLDTYLLESILSYVYDEASYVDYVAKIRQFGALNKAFYTATRARPFLEKFYFYMFPGNIIPKLSTHVTKPTADSCGHLMRFCYMDIHGYIFSQFGTKKGRCQDPTHYDFANRKMKSKFKDLYARCRDKYINFMLEKNNVSNHAFGVALIKKRVLEVRIAECKVVIQKKRRRTALEKLKKEYTKVK